MKYSAVCLFLPTGPLLIDSGQAVKAFVTCQIYPSIGEPSRRQLCAENRMQRALGRSELYPQLHQCLLQSQPQTPRTHRLHQDVVLAVEKVCPGVLVQGLHVLPCRSSKAIFRRAPAGVALPDLHTQPGQVRQGSDTRTAPFTSVSMDCNFLCSQGSLQRNHLDS